VIVFRHSLLLVIFSLIINIVATSVARSDNNIADLNNKAKWTFLVYMVADNDLDAWAVQDFNEMASVGSSQDMKIVVQIDRWNKKVTDYGTKRFLITKGMRINDEPIEKLKELNLGDEKTLGNFVRWGMKRYPAEHYCVVIWNHGAGWRNTVIKKSGNFKKSTVPLKNAFQGFKTIGNDETDNDFLYMKEVQNALTAVTNELNTKIDIVGFDACLMSMLEVWYAIRHNAKYGVGSQDLEPGFGWPYHTILQKLYDNPQMDARSFSITIVDRYKRFCNFARESDPSINYTLSAVDLSSMDNLVSAVNTFSDLMTTNKKIAKICRNECLAYAYDKEYGWPNGIDLWCFADLVEQQTEEQLMKKSASVVKESIDSAVIAEAHNKDNDRYGSHGISIYFPEDQNIFYRDPDHIGYLTDNDYMVVDFVKNERWSKFLLEYYASDKKTQ
jgi:hypothetical protein